MFSIGFEKSSKRKSILKEYYQFCDIEYEEVIKFISTRWLCLELCINREVKKYEGLKSYFLSEDFPDARFKRLCRSYDNPIIEVYLLFYQATLPCFTNFNKYLQREDPVVYQLQDKQQRFMQKLASKFVKPQIIHEHQSENQSLAQLDICLENQKDDMSLGIGPLTRSTLKRLLEEADIDQSEVDQFFDCSTSLFYKSLRVLCSVASTWWYIHDALHLLSISKGVPKFHLHTSSKQSLVSNGSTKC